MGSQTLEILRQGIWASLTGGWFYDPHQNVFCNAVHLYLWLFFLCTPYIIYLYFPNTLLTWSLYCVITTSTVTILKILNMSLHALYDKTQTMSDSNLKKQIKNMKEHKGEEEGDIEMKIIQSELASRLNIKQPIEENSGANSMISVECHEPVSSTIDLKVDVHRKNSSESSDSISAYTLDLQNKASLTHKIDAKGMQNNCFLLNKKSKSEEKPSDNSLAFEEIIEPKKQQSNEDIVFPLPQNVMDNTLSNNINSGNKRNLRNRLHRQSSLDNSDIELKRLRITSCLPDLNGGALCQNKLNYIKPTKLQRHRSSESSDDYHRRNTSVILDSEEQQIVENMGDNLQSSDLYLENHYTKSDLGIEILEKDSNKHFFMQNTKPMRKDSNSTKSAIQLPIASTSGNNIQKRRYSNTNVKSINPQLSNVRRIKSTALEVSCQQPSVSNLSPHPNSAEAIDGQQIKNPQSALLPPPSKSLVRNPHLNLCPKLGNFQNNLNGVKVEPVYPIAETTDEKGLSDALIFNDEIDSENDLDEKRIENCQRCSTTESESDIDRQRTQSTDSETDNNGSRSPLLQKNIRETSEKLKPLGEVNKYYKSLDIPTSSAHFSSNNIRSSKNKNNDNPCSLKEGEQVNTSSKDMLLEKDISKVDNVWVHYNSELNMITIGVDDKQINMKEGTNERNELENFPHNATREGKGLGAIPKTRKEDDFKEDNLCKRSLGAIPKSTSRISLSLSSGSLSAESFNNEKYGSYKDQWLFLNGSSQTSQIFPSNCVQSEVIFNNYSRRPFLETTNYRYQPKLRRTSGTRRRTNTENKSNRLKTNPEIIPTGKEDFGSTDFKNNENTSTQGIINEPYSLGNSVISEPHTTSATILNMGPVELHESAYGGYWWRRSLSADKQEIRTKRMYKYKLSFFGPRELQIAMDRLQLLALFDRDLNWLHVILAIILSSIVCFFGSIILKLAIYQDVFVFLFCVVIAGSQYSLLKSVQPDAASPIHGFNKTVAYSRPIYFCLCSGLLIMFYHLNNDFINSNGLKLENNLVKFFGLTISIKKLLNLSTKTFSTLLLFFPVFFSLGLFPQINTFCMYVLEHIDMHIFGGSAACSLLASVLSTLRSFLAFLLLYGLALGSLVEQKDTQQILFSIFCAILTAIAYHLSRCASDFTPVWILIKSNIVTYPYDEEEINSSNQDYNTQNKSTIISEQKIVNESQEMCYTKDHEDSIVEMRKISRNLNKIDVSQIELIDSPDPLPKKLQNTVQLRFKNDLVVSTILAVGVLALHSSTVFTVLQPDINRVLYIIAAALGIILHYMIPQMRKHLPWLCFARPILKQREYGKFEVFGAAEIMWFETVYVCLCFFERNILYPLIFISALTADSITIVNKFGTTVGAAIISICALKCFRTAYSDSANQYIILIASVLLFRFDFQFASETFLIDYFFISIVFKKSCEFLLKLQFIVTYIAPWQITWGSAFHAFAQPFSVPHSAMLLLQTAISAILSTPLNPFLGSAIFLTSYVRPIKFWERDYNTRRIDHSNTRLSSQLERDLGADDNNLNSIFYEHLTRSLQHSLCGDLLLGRWGTVDQGDCFVLASDYLNCLVHIIELGNGLCTFQMRGLEFRGTYCQQREVEAISEGVEENDGCCCCSPGHLPDMLSANAMFSTRWLAWQVVAAQYVLEGYSISENLATATLQVFEFRKVLISYYVKSIIYYAIKNQKLNEWLSSSSIQDALATTLSRQFVDLDPIFNYNLDEDFDFRALGITRSSFCSVYMNWIQFCYAKRNEDSNKASQKNRPQTSDNNDRIWSSNMSSTTDTASNVQDKDSTTEKAKNQSTTNINENTEDCNENSTFSPITKDSSLVSLCLALGLLARRSLATASHSSLSGVEFFLHGLHALFKGDFRITSPRDEWVFADMELLHDVVAPAVKMALKLHQDHFSSPDEYLDPIVLYEAITSHTKDLVISHEADPMWRSAVLRGAPNLLALRHVMEDGSDEYRIIRLTKRFLSFRVIKLNRECVRGLWAGQQQELIYLRNRNPERGSIQNAKQALRNIINSSCDQPIGYPIYVSPLTTSFAETNIHLCRIIGGSFTLETIRNLIFDWWTKIRKRCNEGCSSGSGGMDCDISNDVPGIYFSPAAANNALSATVGALSYGSQILASAGTRGSLASMNKPTSSTLLAGILNRERDNDREDKRDKSSKKLSQSRNERERRATLPITSTTVSSDSREFVVKEAISSSNTGFIPLNSSYVKQSSNIFGSSENLGKTENKVIIGGSMKISIEEPSNFRESYDISSAEHINIDHLIDINKKVVIIDTMEVYDCLDLGRRIDVIWPSEEMRLRGGRSSWKEWLPQEGMVGVVVHYWQPNHQDPSFRSNVNRILYLVEINGHFVPIGQCGIKEYQCIVNNTDLVIPNISSYSKNVLTINHPTLSCQTDMENNSQSKNCQNIDHLEQNERISDVIENNSTVCKNRYQDLNNQNESNSN